ncbi:hypothetical protein BUALT_Bualt02G0035900 [Buddleja alternifolia]|uniref:Late embryogenesis abundant protein LEA-2 subgroup domain-containing protein n=1 Tax=Buddleja alternifolia TaxID=168488 RepID=A0AAV6Y7U0_9LAMI|nr:hypothetical protein BUALT_Bualt02G0035900 [Buddleja alternifolia]
MSDGATATTARSGGAATALGGVINPKELEYSIEHGSISGYNLSNDGHLNATFNFVLRANNRIDVTVSYEDQQLAASNFHPFYQPRENVTHLELDLASENAVVYGVVARDLRMDKKSGDVDLDVKIRAKVRFEIGFLLRLRKFKVGCGTLTVPLSASKGFKRVLCDIDIDY